MSPKTQLAIPGRSVPLAVVVSVLSVAAIYSGIRAYHEYSASSALSSLHSPAGAALCILDELFHNGLGGALLGLLVLWYLLVKSRSRFPTESFAVNAGQGESKRMSRIQESIRLVLTQPLLIGALLSFLVPMLFRGGLVAYGSYMDSVKRPDSYTAEETVRNMSYGLLVDGPQTGASGLIVFAGATAVLLGIEAACRRLTKARKKV